MEGSCSAPCLVGVVRDHGANSRECRCFLAAARWVRNPGVQARAKLQLQAQAGERREYIHFRHRSISLTQTA
jgi:hypothetical protein